MHHDAAEQGWEVCRDTHAGAHLIDTYQAVVAAWVDKQCQDSLCPILTLLWRLLPMRIHPPATACGAAETSSGQHGRHSRHL
jgi:hypothetical protein